MTGRGTSGLLRRLMNHVYTYIYIQVSIYYLLYFSIDLFVYMYIIFMYSIVSIFGV